MREPAVRAEPAEAPLRVVVADDTPEIRLLLRAALRRAPDLELVGEAADGAEAVRLTAQYRPDLIVLDLAMPVMDGLQAIPEILRSSPSTKILILTGFDRAGVREDARRAGAHALIEKGRPLDDLMRTMRELCGRTQRVVGPAGRRAAAEMVHPAAPDLLGVLGHELSSPVAVISGFATILARDPTALSQEEIATYAGAISVSGKQLQALITTLNDVRAVQEGTLTVQPVAVDVGRFVREIAGSATAAVQPHAVVVGDIEDSVAMVDPVRVRNTIDELLANAARYSPSDAPIEVASRTAGDALEISVEDRCGGIGDEDRARIFGPFVRLRRGGPGLGCGLYLARGIARAHGGDLSCEQAASGCRMVLRLPL